MRKPYTKTNHLTTCLISLALSAQFCVTPYGWAEQESQRQVGLYTAVQGRVTVQHQGTSALVPVALPDAVLLRDVIDTQLNARTRAWLVDESILTVGEHSRVEIAEHVYKPAQDLRSVSINLVAGKVRALVSQLLTGPGSTFEVRTDTAVSVARGTYFVAWYEQNTSGIANIGNHGRVEFTSEGKTVTVEPGHYSMALLGAPPTNPAPYRGSNVPAEVMRAVHGTDMNESPAPETPLEAVTAQGDMPSVRPPKTSMTTAEAFAEASKQQTGAAALFAAPTTPPFVTSTSALK